MTGEIVIKQTFWKGKSGAHRGSVLAILPLASVQMHFLLYFLFIGLPSNVQIA
jgi:hypothetical protein